MEIQRLQSIAQEVFKTLININLDFMKEIFNRSTNLAHRRDNLLSSFPKQNVSKEKPTILGKIFGTK